MKIKNLINKITLGDSFEIIKSLPDKSIDLVLTDPPYGIGMSKNAGLSDKYTSKTWDNERPPKEMFNEILRVSKEQIIFGGNYFVDLLPLGNWAVWDKRCGVIPERTFADGELIYLSYKKPLRIFRFIWDGMLQNDMKNKEIRFHPTQKPVKLLEKILIYYTGLNPPQRMPDFLVADFYGGSASTAIACYNLGFNFICIEKDADYYEKSVKRLDDVQAQLKIPLFDTVKQICGGGGIMIEVDTKEIKKYVQNLKNVEVNAYPKTVRATLDNMAYKTHAEYKKNVHKELTIRGGINNIVLKSVHYDKCGNNLDIKQMQSMVGQQSKTYGKNTDQLRRQEFGENITAKGKHLFKATKFARGGSYKKLVPKQSLISRLDIKHIEDIAANPVKNDTGAQFRQGIAIAHRTHKTIHFLPDKETSRHKYGVFKFWDSGTIIKKGKPHAKGKAAKLLYPFKGKTQQLHERPMLKPATGKISPQCGKIFVEEANRRITKEMGKGLKNG